MTNNRKNEKVGTALKILDEVKQVRRQQWRNSQHVEKMARSYLNRLGIEVSEERLKQFMSAYQEAMNNGTGADELIKKYGQNADQKTVNMLKKYLPKWK
jgi:uncharacterized protein YneF (UPF0154 family)